MKAILLCALAAAIMFPNAALAGSFDTPDVSADMKWTPDECACPEPPPEPEITDLETYNAAVNIFNAYVKLTDKYVECLNKESQRDAKQVIEAINRGSSDAARAARDKIRKMRGHLDANHPHNKPL